MIPEWLRALLGDAAAPGLEAAAPWLIGALIFGYLMGSIPFGPIVAKAMGLGDLRKVGSGNIGATNVLRTGSKKAAALVLLLDGLKGAAPALIAGALAGRDAAALAGMGAVLGHCFPVWLRFRGGKGVATFLGMLLGLAWPAGLAACAIWLGMAALLRISSLSALVAAALSPAVLVAIGRPEALIPVGFCTLLVWARHHANIARLLRGEEPKIGAKKKGAA